MRDRDYTDTLSFLAKFFEHTTGQVEFRVIANNSGATAKPIFTRDGDIVATFCQIHDKPGNAVYFACCTRKQGASRGRREDLLECIALWVDIDLYKLGLLLDEVVAALESSPIPPSLIVLSGGGVHAYWLLREPMVVEWADAGDGVDEVKDRIDAALLQLAGVFAGDSAVCQVASIMRLPGTVNSKREEPVLCRVLEATEYRYELEDIEDQLFQLRPLLAAPVWSQTQAAQLGESADADPFTAFAAAYAGKPPLDVEQAVRNMTYQGAGDTGIHRSQLLISSSLIGRGGTDDEDIVLLLMENTRRAAGPAGARWNWKREEKAIRSMIATWHQELLQRGTHPSQRAAAAALPPDPKVVQLRPRDQAEPESAPKPPPETAPEFLGYPLNDLGNTMRMLALHGRDIRYCVAAGWYLWDGKRFAFDTEGNRVRRRAQATVVHMKREAGGLATPDEAAAKRATTIFKYAIASANKKGIDGMISEARPQVRIDIADLDANSMLFNARNGTVNLATGEFRAHDRADMLSKLGGADYDPAAACPRWERFVSEIFDGNQEIIGFVQRALGYSLTGDTREEAIFILHGNGANGKTVLIETMAAMMGNYARYSPAEVWTVAKDNDRQSAHDLAALVGARFVPVVETERNRQLAEARIKQATGGDKITACHKYKDPFEYQPQFKLWFSTNHKPKIKGSDYGIWRRVHLIPFSVQFVDQVIADDEGGKRIKEAGLAIRLRNEMPGILAWMVRGCMEWRRLGGLRAPAAVVVATKDYQTSEDNISGFIDARCNVRRSFAERFGTLYAAYEIWCEENDEEAQTKRVFGQGLTERGHMADRDMKERTRKGLQLKPEFEKAARERETADGLTHTNAENHNTDSGLAKNP